MLNNTRRYENQPIIGVTHICNRGGFVFYEPLEDDKPDDFETYYMVGVYWMDDPISDVQLCKVEYELVEDEDEDEDEDGEPIDLRAFVEYGANRIYLDEVMRA